MSSNAKPKESRLVARVSEEIQEIIQRAAEHTGASISQFLIDSAMEKAKKVIAESETLKLSMAGSEALYEALEKPPKANKKLLKAKKHHKETVNVNNR